MTKDELKRRTRRFALDVIGLVESLPRTRTAEVIGRRLLRSATSVGANYRAAGSLHWGRWRSTGPLSAPYRGSVRDFRVAGRRGGNVRVWGLWKTGRLYRLSAGLDVTAYQANRLVRSSVERELILIGEAMATLSRVAPPVFDRITHARRIVDFRNQLTHAYATVDDALVWAIAETDVPVLRRECAALRDLPRPDRDP